MPAVADLIYELRVDEPTWEKGTEARQHEWRLLCNEVVEEGRFEGELMVHADRGRGVIHVNVGDVAVEVSHHHGVLREAVSLGLLTPLVDDYVKICREMTKVGLSSARMEALDIAKRIAHDEAAVVIVDSLHRLRPDHGTARRFFSLFVTLLYDTTKLSVRPHTLHY